MEELFYLLEKKDLTPSNLDCRFANNSLNRVDDVVINSKKKMAISVKQ